MNGAAEQLQEVAHIAVVLSELQLFEKHKVSDLLWGYQPKFPYLIQRLLVHLKMLPTWGIYVGVITLFVFIFNVVGSIQLEVRGSVKKF